MPFKGVYRSPSKLADGTTRYYYYTHRGGPRFYSCDHTPIEDQSGRLPQDFIDDYQAAKAITNSTPARGSVRATLSRYFDKSPRFKRMSTKGRFARRGYLETWCEMKLKDKSALGSQPVCILDRRRIIPRLVDFRDETWGHSPSASDEAVIALSAFLTWCINDGRLDFNRASSIESVYERPTAARAWSKKEQLAFLEACRPELRHGLLLNLYTGLRREDLIKIPLTAETNQHLIIRTGKSRQRRQVIIPKVPPLRALLTEIAVYRAKFDVQATTILVRSNGRPWSSEAYGKAFDRHRSKIGLGPNDNGPTIHDLRKTAATHMVILQNQYTEITDQVLIDLFGWTDRTLSKMKRIYVDDSAVIAAITGRP